MITPEEKQKAVNEILERVFRIELHPFLRRGNEVLREMLINGKGVKETSKSLNLPLTRVKQLFPQATNVICGRLATLNDELRTASELEKENKLLREKLRQFEEKKEQLDSLPEKTRKMLAIKLEDIDFPVRAVNSCRMDGIHTLGDLVKLSKREFLSMRNIGKKCLGDVEQVLSSRDLRWEMKI